MKLKNVDELITRRFDKLQRIERIRNSYLAQINRLKEKQSVRLKRIKQELTELESNLLEKHSIRFTHRRQVQESVIDDEVINILKANEGIKCSVMAERLQQPYGRIYSILRKNLGQKVRKEGKLYYSVFIPDEVKITTE